MAISQLIHVSDLVDKNESELARILESAVRHNGENSITGIVLYSEGNFLQVPEGTHDSVHEKARESKSRCRID